MFTNIIWATDGSEHADRALELAAQLARSEGATLHVVHVVEKIFGTRLSGRNTFLNEEDIRAKIERQAAEAGDGTGITSTLQMTSGASNEVAKRITEVAGETGADLIIVGTRGHSAVAGAFLGSVTQRLLHLAHCPVLAVPPTERSAHEAEKDDTLSAAR